MTDREELLARVVEHEIASAKEGMPHHAAMMVELNMTPQQMCALMTLESHDALPTSAVCEAVGVKPNVASGIVQRLVDRGYISREESPEDRRVRLLHLTAEGRQFAQAMTADLRDLKRRQFAALSDEQLEQLYEIQLTLAHADVSMPVTMR